MLTGVVACGFEIISSPIGAVGKALADGTITEKVRFFHHLSKNALGLDPNKHIDKAAHGGCLYPVIKSIVRRILQLKLRYPGTKVMLDISDVAGAFTLVDINENCVDEFAADMPMGVDGSAYTWSPSYSRAPARHPRGGGREA